MARPKPKLNLSADERQKLTNWANRPKSSQRLALRARIVLTCATKPSNKVVAITEKRIRRGVFKSVPALERAIIE